MQTTGQKQAQLCAKQSHLKRIEAELHSMGAISPVFLKLNSVEGFIDYYLEMRDLYPSYREAYERLEDFYFASTGKRRYSEYNSFRKVMDRSLARQRKRWDTEHEKRVK